MKPLVDGGTEFSLSVQFFLISFTATLPTLEEEEKKGDGLMKLTRKLISFAFTLLRKSETATVEPTPESQTDSHSGKI